MTSGKLACGILTGFAAGAVLGILFAPDKGSETRRKISEKSTDFSDAIVNGLNRFTEAVSSKYESIKENTAELLDEGRDELQKLRAEENIQPSIL